MSTIFVAWIVTGGFSFASLAWLAVSPPADGSWARALRRSGAATLPAVLPLIEYAVRGHTDFAPWIHCLRLALFLGCGGGFILIVASFLDSPLMSSWKVWALVRLVHVVAWGCTVAVAAAMLLDT